MRDRLESTLGSRLGEEMEKHVGFRRQDRSSYNFYAASKQRSLWNAFGKMFLNVSNNAGMMVPTCNLSTQESEVGGSRV